MGENTKNSFSTQNFTLKQGFCKALISISEYFGFNYVLDGVVTDDGLSNLPNEMSLLWEMISGPGTVSFDPNANVTNPSVSFPSVGRYVLQLTADDGQASTSDTVVIVVVDDLYGGGSGTAIDPYLLNTDEHFIAVGVNPQHWGKHFVLMNDIDLSLFDGQAGRAKYLIIGSSDTPFVGNLNGNGY